MKRVAVVGGGWAGIAAAVRAVRAGHAVTLLEMAPQLGGRARAVSGGASEAADASAPGHTLDNGQHILIGAYRRTLDLMRTVGVDVDGALHRRPLTLRYPDGRGLQLPAGPTWLAFVRAVASANGWSAHDRIALLRAAAGWALARFRCRPELTVDALCAGLPPAVRALLIDPLCVAALNTPAQDASAQVLLRVLHDALFGGKGGADLLLPRQSLSALLPMPAERWFAERGVAVRLRARVQALAPVTAAVQPASRPSAPSASGQQASGDAGWLVDGVHHDAVILACSAQEAARLATAHASAWAEQAKALRYEPIVTVYLLCPGARLPSPMTALLDGPEAPAQFAFDHSAIAPDDPAAAGRFAFVVSGASRWVDAGTDATVAAVIHQALTAFPPGAWPRTPTLLRAITEKRATFRCTPGLKRPAMDIAPGLLAAGDYVDGPYPATLEGAVQSGEAAAARLFTRR